MSLIYSWNTCYDTAFCRVILCSAMSLSVSQVIINRVFVSLMLCCLRIFILILIYPIIKFKIMYIDYVLLKE